LLPTLIRILSHSPCNLEAFVNMRQKRGRYRTQAMSGGAPLTQDLKMQVVVQEHVLCVLCTLCSRPSIRLRLQNLGGFAPIVTIAYQGAGGRNKILAQKLVAKMALSEEERREVAMLEACLASK